MKKTIICFGIALMSFVGAQANNQEFFNAPTTVTAYANTPLCTAISKGDLDAVRKFVEYGADVNEISDNGYTPLMMAARYNRTDIVQILLDKGADVGVKNERGQNALKIAEQFNAKETAELLRSAK